MALNVVAIDSGRHGIYSFPVTRLPRLTAIADLKSPRLNNQLSLCLIGGRWRQLESPLYVACSQLLLVVRAGSVSLMVH